MEHPFHRLYGVNKMLEQIDAKSMRTLEYQKVIDQLSTFTVSELGNGKAKTIKPSSARSEVVRLLEETDDAVQLLRLKGGIPLGSFHDVRPHLKRMEIGALLSGQEIVQVGQLLKGVREIIEFFEDVEESIQLNRLFEMSNQFVGLKSLERQIYATLTESGVVVDDASPKLKSTRMSIRQTEGAIRDKLNSIVRGSQAKYLTDTIITMRNDRYVIPVKAENRSSFGGVVHAQSSSGQTLYIEPQGVLDSNNKLKRLQSEEKHEVERILMELSEAIVPYIDDILLNLELMVELDVLQAKARYARELKATRPNVDEENIVQLYSARHPLIPADEIVANDIVLGELYKTIVVTGPNTGGKTVILKTLGLMQLMGQSGLYLPVEEESSIGVFNHVLSDIGDEQSIEQSLSTFSSHLTTIVSILEVIDANSLVLLDELGAGTDPQEGAALAISILDKIGAIGSFAVITSHYPELKLYGYNRPETVNASMEFNVDTLEPTYKFKIGIPGRSNAFLIAQRLGLESDIIDVARSLMSSESQSIDEMINDLDIKQKEADNNSRTLRKRLLETERLYKDLEEAYEAYENEKEQLKQKAQEDANKIVEQTKRKADAIIADLRQKQLDAENAPAIKEHEFIEAQSQLSNLRQEEEQLKQNKVLQKEKEKRVLKVGQTVQVHSFGQAGTLVEQVDGEWIVQMGMLKMRIPEDDITVTEQASQENETPKTTFYGSTSSVRPELDLRGERVDTALTKLDQYIDQALLANYKNVTIIHGHGTGAVRSAVQGALKKHSSVKDFKIAPANQGGAGATIVSLS